MRFSKIHKFKNVIWIFLLIGVITTSLGILSISYSNIFSTITKNLTSIKPMSVNIKVAQELINDAQHDFYYESDNSPVPLAE